MKKYVKWIVCFLCLIVFLFLGYLVKTNNDILLDKMVYNFISIFINSNVTNVVKIITSLGGACIVILINILLLIFLKNKKVGIFTSLNLIIITIFQYILKSIFGRSRPIDVNLINESGYSFPSGHSLTSMAFYGFIIYLIYKSNLKNKKIYIIALSLLVLLIGLSRVYLGVHFVTDVLGGFTFSIFYLIIFINVVKNKINI